MKFRFLASAPFAATLVGLFARKDAVAQVQPYPPTFRTQRIETNGTTLFVRVGGKGPAVVLLHGFGETGDTWKPLAIKLIADHTVIIPDLRGMGLSSRPGSRRRTRCSGVCG